MPTRNLSALATLLSMLVASAHAQTAQVDVSPTYAVLSLIGDQLDAVTYQPQVGTLLEANSHAPIPMGMSGLLDMAALRETNKALRAAAPVNDVALLAASSPGVYADESRLFEGDQVKLPPDLDGAVTQAKAQRLLLITKHRGEAHLKTAHGTVGSGQIEGLGFYVDTVHRVPDANRADRNVGFLSPFVYADVTLVDTATHTIIARTTITASETVVPGSGTSGAGIWDLLAPADKIATLARLLTTGLDEAIPQLVHPPKPVAATAEANGAH